MFACGNLLLVSEFVIDLEGEQAGQHAHCGGDRALEAIVRAV